MEKKHLFYFSILSIFSNCQLALASGMPIIENPLVGINNLPSLLCIIFNGLVTIGVPILTLVIVIAGCRWMMSMGNSAEITQARAAIWYAAIGMIVIMSSSALYKFIIDALQIHANAC